MHNNGPFYWDPGRGLCHFAVGRKNNPIGFGKISVAVQLEPESFERASLRQSPRIETPMRHGPVWPSMLGCPPLCPWSMSPKERVHDQ